MWAEEGRWSVLGRRVLERSTSFGTGIVVVEVVVWAWVWLTVVECVSSRTDVDGRPLIDAQCGLASTRPEAGGLILTSSGSG